MLIRTDFHHVLETLLEVTGIIASHFCQFAVRHGSRSGNFDSGNSDEGVQSTANWTI